MDIRQETFLLGDLISILRSLMRARLGPLPSGAYANGYNDGFRAAIEAVAEAIGVRGSSELPPPRLPARRR